MSEIQGLPVLTADKRRTSILAALALSFYAFSTISGCSVKKTAMVAVPPKIAQAKTATFEDLLHIVNNYSKIYELSSNDLRVTLTTGRLESGILEKYKKARAYVLLRRPDSIRLVIQDPILKSAQLDMLSVGDDFYLWIRSRNEFYIGKNSAKVLIAPDLPESPEIPIRPRDIFDAILPEGINTGAMGATRIALEEDVDAEAKYYVLTIYKEGIASVSYTLRKIWIERASLTIARQRFFDEKGMIVGDVVYSGMEMLEGFALPLKIHMDRPREGYALDLEFNEGSWRVNPRLQDKAFVLTPPQGAKIIHLEEKGRSDDF
jgi:hypothetical protein